MTVGAHPAGRTICCIACGAGYAVELTERSLVSCPRCSTELVRTTGRSLDLALACSATTLIMLVPANLLPFLETSLMGVSQRSWLVSSATVMWKDGWPWLGVAIGAFVVIAPLARFSLLTVVLLALKVDRRPLWLGRAFRWSNSLQPWAMPDVFLLGLWIAYARLHAAIAVTVHAGAICFIAAGLLTLFTRAVLSKAEIWNMIAAGDRLEQVPLACPSCELAHAEAQAGLSCARCGDVVHRRKAGALEYASALTVAGGVLYILANFYPMATMPVGLTPSSYTVLQGALDLLRAHLYPLAVLVFTVSFAVPLLKLAGMSWLVSSVVRRSPRRLHLKTKLYHIVEEVGRWSMVDPFVIACFVPVMQYNSLVYGQADGAATAFTAVVVATMVAARCFDPRLMWDVEARGE